PLNLDRFDGESAGAQEILDACRTVPLLGGGRLVRVDQAAKLSAADQERLAEALPSVPPESGLIFLWGKEWRSEEAKKPLMGAAALHGHIVIFWPLFPEQAQRWVRQRAGYYQKEIAPEAAAWLVENVGEGLRLLDQELAKAGQFTGTNSRIGLEDVQASFGYQ